MAKILISEIDPDVRRLLTVLVTRLGHEPVVLDPDVAVPPRGDLLLLEPEARTSIGHARLVRAYFPELPVICMGAIDEGGCFLKRGPLRFLPKPFTLDQMGELISHTLSPN
jgi:DNA-binding NtrC family response regulator